MASSEGHPCKIFIGNLPFALSQNGVADLFRPFGTVIGVKLVEDRATGKKKGFGFVTFETPASADAAIARMSGKDIDGRSLTVKRATYRGEKSAENDDEAMDVEGECDSGEPTAGVPDADGWGMASGKKRGRNSAGSSFQARAKAKESEGKLLGWGSNEDDWA
eukprot:TRINITY_DN27689_c0_g1_i2.p1 TRINITY_DN27689_c0_g1~~TRINITY_DN27689_c0_g1_i2.p1  ORF type:complete len:163 (-),score=24.91 TRINITY_DN27689_c0_g1_i2:303-791(-)